jgi:RarD protein
MKSKIQFSLSMVIFGTIGIFIRYINLDSSAVALLRGLIGSLFLLGVILFTRQKISWEKIKKNALILLISGAALGANWIFLFEAYRHTTVANAALSYYFAPVFLLCLSPVVLKEKLSVKKIVCIGAAMLGMFLIVGNSGDAEVRNHLQGIAFGLTAAGFYASLMLMNKFIKNLTGLETTLIQLIAASLLLLPYVLLSNGRAGLMQTAGVSLLLVLILGVVHTGIGFFLFFSGMKDLKGQSIATLSYLDPITSVILSFALLQETMTPLALTGAAILLGATFVSERRPVQA